MSLVTLDRKILFTDEELEKLYKASNEYQFVHNRVGGGYFNGFFRVYKDGKLIVLSCQNEKSKVFIKIFDTDDLGSELYSKPVSSVEEFIEFLAKGYDEVKNW